MTNTKKLDARQSLIDKATTAGMAARILSICINLATVPIVISSLNKFDFAVWASITSLISTFLFLDFGIGNSAMGRITEALAHNDQSLATKLIQHAYLVLNSISIAMLVIVCFAYATGITEVLARHTGSFLSAHIDLVTGFTASYSLVIPATFVQRLLFAHQKAGIASILQLVFSLSYLLLVAFAHWMGLDIVVFVLGYVLLMVIVYGGYSWYFLRHFYPQFKLKGRADRQIIMSLLKGAGLYFLLQMTVSAVYNSDNIILTAVATPEEVAAYATAWRMFSLIMMINGIILGPLWPAVTDAKAKGEWTWIKAAYIRHLKRSMVASIVLATALIVIGNDLLRVWTGGRIQAPNTLLILLGFWFVLEGYGQCMAMLLNGLHILRLQLIVAILLLIIGSGIKIYLAKKYGLYGPVLGTIVAFLFIVGISETIFIHRMTERNL